MESVRFVSQLSHATTPGMEENSTDTRTLFTKYGARSPENGEMITSLDMIVEELAAHYEAMSSSANYAPDFL